MSSTKPNNPPAFPVPRTEQDCGEAGMSYLDYFAGQALAGATSIEAADNWPVESMARYCYDVAAAMLAEREAR